ncbi:MAG: hypothetical protein Q8W44_12375 [Candidatus Palauibacterales bacterium]|nr:hypothetical protein [Candidatus Palauibacterales bacterium]
MTYARSRRAVPRLVLLALGLLCAHAVRPGPAGAAQEADSVSPAPPDTVAAVPDSILDRLDRLEAEVRTLRSTLDSLDAAGAERAAPPGDARADLREAARAAAKEAASERPDTGGGGTSRTRSLQALNPEISVTGDFVASALDPGGAGDEVTATPRGVELSLQAALDPYTRMKVYAVREEELEIAGLPHEEGEGGEEEHAAGVDVEEAYMYWVGLPGGFGARIGKFRQELGLYNRWHTHALFEVDRPLAATTFLGEGLIQPGVGLTLPSFALGPAGQTLTLEAARADNTPLFGEEGDLSYLARYRSFIDLGPASYLQVGATGVYGENDGSDLESRLLGLDLSYRWRPPSRGRYRDLQLKSEWFFAERETGALSETGHGGYLQANLRLDRSWTLGARGDWVDGYGDGPGTLLQLAPSVSWWQSEWVRLRLQYNWLHPDVGSDGHTLLFQVVWAAGPHKHETY